MLGTSYLQFSIFNLTFLVRDFKKGNADDIFVEESSEEQVKVSKKKGSKKAKKNKKKVNEDESIKITSLDRSRTLLELSPKSTKVQHFFVNPHLQRKFTQISDHYGVESTIILHEQ